MGHYLNPADWMEPEPYYWIEDADGDTADRYDSEAAAISAATELNRRTFEVIEVYRSDPGLVPVAIVAGGVLFRPAEVLK